MGAGDRICLASDCIPFILPNANSPKTKRCADRGRRNHRRLSARSVIASSVAYRPIWRIFVARPMKQPGPQAMNRISAHLQPEQRIGLSGLLTYVITYAPRGQRFVESWARVPSRPSRPRTPEPTLLLHRCIAFSLANRPIPLLFAPTTP